MRVKTTIAAAASAIVAAQSAQAEAVFEESEIGNPKEFFLQMQCGPGEEKILVQRGVNDNFATGNTEVSEMSDPVKQLTHFQIRQIAGYDATASNQHFLDHVELPAGVTDGYVMLAIRAISGNSNDNIQIGDLASVYNNLDDVEKRLAFVSRINMLATSGWWKSGNHYSAPLGSLPLRASGKTVLSLIQESDEESIIDVHVQDDTAVDYVVFGLCVRRGGGEANTKWTKWLNRDRPGGKGDYETVAGHVEDGNACENPTAIQCRSTDGKNWTATGEKYYCEESLGGRCVNAEQPDGQCQDYEVRFKCPK